MTRPFQPSSQQTAAQTLSPQRVVIDGSSVEVSTLRIFDFLEPWMDHPFLCVETSNRLTITNLLTYKRRHSEVPAIQGFALQIQSATCQLVETLGRIRDAAERGFEACGEGLDVCRAYHGLTSQDEIVRYTAPIRSAIDKGLQATQTSLEKLEAMHQQLLDVRYSPEP